jgi:hypothetical protein
LAFRRYDEANSLNDVDGRVLLLLRLLPDVFDVRVENRRELIYLLGIERFTDRSRDHFHLPHVATLETTIHRIPDVGEMSQVKQTPDAGESMMDGWHRPHTATGTGRPVLITDLFVRSIGPRNAILETAKFAKITSRAAATIEVGDSVGQFPDSSSF